MYPEKKRYKRKLVFFFQFFFFLWDVLLSYVVVLITTFVFQECVFGNQLPACELVSDSIQIPTLVARLINEIENKGEKGFEISV